MLIHRLLYLIKKKIKRKAFKRWLWVLLALIVILIISVWLFWLEYTGRDEQITSRYPGLGFVERLPKLLDIYYLPLMIKGSSLPEYTIEIDNKYLKKLEQNLPQDQCCNCLSDDATDYMPARFFYSGQEYKVEIKIKGDCWNHWAYPKKSWRIKFEDDFFGDQQIELVIPVDREFIAEYLNNYRAQKLDLAVSKMQFVTLKINHHYYGVYQQEERVTNKLLERNTEAGDVNIYGDQTITDRLFLDPASWRKYNQDAISKVDNYAELNLLLELVNDASDEDFFAKIPNLVDMDNFYRWSILSMLAGSYHQDFAHNMRIYFDNSLGKFKFIPADIGVSSLPPVDVIYNPLADRIIKNPDFVFERNKILWDYVKNDDNLIDDLAVYQRAYDQVRWATYRDFKNNYSNFYFDKKVKLRKQRFEDVYLEIQNIFKKDEKVGVVTDITEEQVSQISSKAIMARLEFYINNFSGVSLKEVGVELIKDKQIQGELNLYYDTNQNKILDSQDLNLGKFKKQKEDEFIIQDIKQDMLADRWVPQLIDYSSDDYLAGRGPLFKPVRIKMTTHNFFVTSGQKQTQIFDKFKFKLRNAITHEKIDYDKVAIDNTTFQNFDQINLNPGQFVAYNPAFKLHDNTLRLGPGDFEFRQSLIIPHQVEKLVIAPGTNLKLDSQVSIFSYTPIEAVGNQENPIRIGRLDNSKAWGVLAIINQQSKLSQLDYVVVDGGGQAYVNGVFVSGQLAFHWSDTKITNSEFSGTSGDDGLNIKYGLAILVNNKFHHNQFDALDLDYVKRASQVLGNIFENNGNDGIDISGSPILIEDNQILSSGDKCISVGEHSDAVIFNNLLNSCLIGIAVKDLSNPIIINNTIINNDQAIAAYQKKEIFGGGFPKVYNSIIWNNKEAINLDKLSTIEISFSSIQGGYQGEANVNIEPKFSHNYLLTHNNDQKLKSGGNVEVLKEYMHIEFESVSVGMFE